MQQSLLDECHESILKIAETQPPDGKTAILAMAEVFQVNSGRMSTDGQPSSLQDFHASDRAANGFFSALIARVAGSRPGSLATRDYSPCTARTIFPIT
jgi:hypothetical protein